MKKTKRLVKITAAFLAVMMLTIVCINCLVILKTRDRIILVEDAALLDADYILTLGCGLRPDGSPSDMLADRVTVATDVYVLSEDAVLLMSGDNSGEHYNEVGAMREFAIKLGADGEDILSDDEGFSTYESVFRAKNEFGAERLIIVTQGYHLYRALYIAKRMGIDAYGVSADLREYRGQTLRDLREVAARVKDFLCTLFP
jgi:vancomycin permeability regulator SanA